MNKIYFLYIVLFILKVDISSKWETIDVYRWDSAHASYINKSFPKSGSDLAVLSFNVHLLVR